MGSRPGSDETASPHLASRAEVGQILLDGPVPAVVLQAGVIIGSGSASFEMLRYLTERLPVMVTPRWVTSRVQPIAVRDVLSYLIGQRDMPEGTNRRFDIAGPDVLTYRDMMQRYARVAGLRRRIIIPVRVLSPWLSSQWVNVVTPVPKAIAQPLIESLRNSVVAGEPDIDGYVDVDPVRLRRRRAPGAGPDPQPGGRHPLVRCQLGRSADRPDADGPGLERRHCVPGRALPGGGRPPDEVWRAVEGIGGERGWYSWQLAWAVRGLLDRLVGGVGLRRGRRHPDVLNVGEAVDFWRVEELERPRLLRLRAEMRLPGEAWLEFRIEPDPRDGGRSVLHQHALFLPRGLAGTGLLVERAALPRHRVRAHAAQPGPRGRAGSGRHSHRHRSCRRKGRPGQLVSVVHAPPTRGPPWTG